MLLSWLSLPDADVAAAPAAAAGREKKRVTLHKPPLADAAKGFPGGEAELRAAFRRANELDYELYEAAVRTFDAELRNTTAAVRGQGEVAAVGAAVDSNCVPTSSSAGGDGGDGDGGGGDGGESSAAGGRQPQNTTPSSSSSSSSEQQRQQPQAAAGVSVVGDRYDYLLKYRKKHSIAQPFSPDGDRYVCACLLLVAQRALACVRACVLVCAHVCVCVRVRVSVTVKGGVWVCTKDTTDAFLG